MTILVQDYWSAGRASVQERYDVSTGSGMVVPALDRLLPGPVSLKLAAGNENEDLDGIAGTAGTGFQPIQYSGRVLKLARQIAQVRLARAAENLKMGSVQLQPIACRGPGLCSKENKRDDAAHCNLTGYSYELEMEIY
jgi:hypothetical protein